MNRRFFILDKYNTWYDWRCTLTAKKVPPAEPKTNFINIDGVSGTLDLSEALTGEPVYGDRIVTASFMCSEGTHKDREALLRQITAVLHGRRVQVVEPDDPERYFLGRVRITEATNYPAYLSFTVEATCDPWRYALEETTRTVTVAGDIVRLVINNDGDKTLCPAIKATGAVSVTVAGVTMPLPMGAYKLSDLRLTRGANVVTVAGTGSVSFIYQEAVL